MDGSTFAHVAPQQPAGISYANFYSVCEPVNNRMRAFEFISSLQGQIRGRLFNNTPADWHGDIALKRKKKRQMKKVLLGNTDWLVSCTEWIRQISIINLQSSANEQQYFWLITDNLVHSLVYSLDSLSHITVDTWVDERQLTLLSVVEEMCPLRKDKQSCWTESQSVHLGFVCFKWALTYSSVWAESEPLNLVVF